MKKYLQIVAAVIMMLCLGGVYAWSIFAVELKNIYGFTSAQSQIIFGTLIGIFTLTMIWGDRIINLTGPRIMGTLAGFLFFTGYYIAFLSKGNFYLMIFGIGIFGGIATGFGYLLSITVPVSWFPHKKGLITGIVTAGFGAGAVVLSYISSYLLKITPDILRVMLIIGLSYGTAIIAASQFFGNYFLSKGNDVNTRTHRFITDWNFIRLFSGIFTGTFAGLLVIGNLKSIGLLFSIHEIVLIKGIALFSIANFTGRIFWGGLNDYITGNILMPLSVFLIGIFTLLAGHIQLNGNLYLILAFCIGFCFGANFVIYAKETAQIYGLSNLGKVYPFVFLGYGLSGIISPFIGGYLYDITSNYRSASSLSFFLCCITSILLIFSVLALNKTFLKN
jgi:OFA family oxalate/formate antiporter-like MFS transporter